MSFQSQNRGEIVRCETLSEIERGLQCKLYILKILRGQFSNQSRKFGFVDHEYLMTKRKAVCF